MHRFEGKLSQGQFHEKYLDFVFTSLGYNVEQATIEEEHRGIDRWITDKRTGERVAVQYKADERAEETGNAFIETISVDTFGIPGWAHTCEAEYMFYFLPQSGELYVIEPEVIREQLSVWEEKYEQKPALNVGYRTWGICVPLEELKKSAKKVFQLPHCFVRRGLTLKYRRKETNRSPASE